MNSGVVLLLHVPQHHYNMSCYNEIFNQLKYLKGRQDAGAGIVYMCEIHT